MTKAAKVKKATTVDYSHPDYCEGTRTYFGPIRDVHGHIGHLQGGSYFNASERFSMYDFEPRFASCFWQIQLVELNNGNWLCQDLAVYSPQFPSREVALRHAAARILRQVRTFFRPDKEKYKYGIAKRVSELEYRTVIAWIYDVLKRPAPSMRVVARPIVSPVETPRYVGQLEMF